jgi:hypothetical protein
MKPVIKIIIIAILFINTSCDNIQMENAESSNTTTEWIYVSYDNEGHDWYIQSNYVAKDPDKNQYKTWIKYAPKLTENANTLNDKTTFSMELVEVNCDTRQVKRISVSTYGVEDKKLLSTKDIENQIFTDVVPESIGAKVLNKICELYNNQ